MVVDGIDLCQLNADVGPCDEFETAFYYNAEVDRCERFTWGGCDGNANRFSALRDCERRCREQSAIRRPPTAQHDGTTVQLLRATTVATDNFHIVFANTEIALVDYSRR